VPPGLGLTLMLAQWQLVLALPLLRPCLLSLLPLLLLVQRLLLSAAQGWLPLRPAAHDIQQHPEN
jgi:hypothetical protein